MNILLVLSILYHEVIIELIEHLFLFIFFVIFISRTSFLSEIRTVILLKIILI